MMYAIMHRTQLLLEPWQYEALRLRAEREGRSLSAILRDILTEHLDPAGGRVSARLAAIEGVAEGPPDLGRNHDRHLYGAGPDERRD
jgi:plasmid stability protein